MSGSFTRFQESFGCNHFHQSNHWSKGKSAIRIRCERLQ